MRAALLALALCVGCYASHELGPCGLDDDCGPMEYCELRLLCVELDDGSVECNPTRSGYGCAWLEGRIVCESSRTTGLGWCVEPAARGVWR